MTLLTPQELTLPTNDPASEHPEGLADLSARSLWRSGAPDSVRRTWNAGGHEQTWPDWRGWLAERESLNPFVDLPRRAGSPIAWGADESLADEIARPIDAARVAQWLDDEAERACDVRFALECVALADAAPKLAASLDAADWWRLGDKLLGIATEAAAATPRGGADDTVVEQLLGGELPYALAAALPELKPMHQLRPAGAAALSDALERVCDGEGLPHADLLPRLPLLAACWTRCRLRAQALGKKPWSSDGDTQYEWLVRQLLRMVNREGRLPFATASPVGVAPLLRRMLEEAGDEEDLAAAAMRLKGFSTDDEDADPPEPSNHSEWAGVTVLSSGWNDRAPRLTVTHADRTMRIELHSDRRTLLSGDWPLLASRDGVAVEAADDWDVSCWFSDEDCDYLELSIDLKGGGTLERLLFLSREDGVAMLGELLLTDEKEPSPLSLLTSLPLAEGVGFSPEKETWDATLDLDGKPRACAFPLALPEWRQESNCGALHASDGLVQYHVEATGKNLAAPIWLDLAPKRFAKQRTWRRLTIAESLKKVGPDVAIGYRVQSAADQWLMYRSLTPPANRTLLGHNLSSEALIGRFLKTGEVDEYFEIDDE